MAINILKCERILSHNHPTEKSNRLLWIPLAYTGSGVKDNIAMWLNQPWARKASSCLHGLAPMDRLGSTEVAYMEAVTPAGLNSRNISIHSETTNWWQVCEILLLFSQQHSNSIHLLWRRERKAGNNKMNPGEIKKNDLFKCFLWPIFLSIYSHWLFIGEKYT